MGEEQDPAEASAIAGGAVETSAVEASAVEAREASEVIEEREHVSEGSPSPDQDPGNIPASGNARSSQPIGSGQGDRRCATAHIDLRAFPHQGPQNVAEHHIDAAAHGLMADIRRIAGQPEPFVWRTAGAGAGARFASQAQCFRVMGEIAPIRVPRPNRRRPLGGPRSDGCRACEPSELEAPLPAVNE